MQNTAFHAIEHAAWSQRAGVYDAIFAGISTQAIPYFLGCAAHWRGLRHLDIACGTGHLVAAAAQQGAFSEGVDFAAPMVDAARANYPGARFTVANAARLPQETAAFDAATCAFGLQHMAAPQAACDEAYRVLKPGGFFAFALWYGPDSGGEFHAIVEAAMRAHATLPSPLPVSATGLRYAHPDDCAALVRESGFNPPMFRTLPIVGRSAAAEDALRIIDKLSVRTAAVIAAQPPSVQARIHEHILAELEARRSDGVIELAWPALLTIAEKPHAN